MRKFDELGLTLCKLQANVFAQSKTKIEGSIYLFIRKYMYSDVCEKIDKLTYIYESTDIFSNISVEGKNKNEISEDILYWVGYIYRYWAYTYELSSKKIYKIVPGKEMISLYGGNVVRFILVNSYYRTPVNFSDSLAMSAKKELDKIEQALNKMSVHLQLANISVTNYDGQLDMEGFLSALCNDLNTPNALTEVYRIVKESNIFLRSNPAYYEGIALRFFTLRKMLEILGLEFPLYILTDEDRGLFEEYNQARRDCNYFKADEIRKILIEKKLL